MTHISDPGACTEQPRLERIENRLGGIEKTLDTIHDSLIGSETTAGAYERLREVEREHKVIWTKLDEITQVIVGNGKPGLTERVRVLEQVRQKQERLSMMLVGGVLVQVLVIIRTLVMGG